jgi:hypothetical protein
MPFIGNQPALSYTSFAKQDFTTSATTSYTLDHPVTNENEIALFINFVRQEPTTAYTASGTSLTLTSATSASDDMYCVFLGKAVQTVNPPNGSVGTAQLADSSVTSAKLAVKNTPAFLVKKTTAQTVTDNYYTKIQFDSEEYDTDNAFDNSTNYRFTVPSGKAGKYFIYSRLTLDSNGTGSDYIISTLYKNGSRVFASRFYEGGTDLDEPSVSLNITLDLAESDYLELYGTMAIGSGNPTLKLTADSAYLNWFGAYKIIE